MDNPKLPENPTPEQRMAWEALLSQTAPNPRGLARSLVEWLDYFAERGGTANCDQPEIRLLVHQIASVTGGVGLSRYDLNSEAYHEDLEACRKKIETADAHALAGNAITGTVLTRDRDDRPPQPYRRMA
jgi:hypothetical protein